MADDKKLEDQIKDKDALIAELQAENAALKASAPSKGEEAPVSILSEKERTFTASVKDKKGKESKATCVLGNVVKIYIDRVKYSAEVFMKDAKLQQRAVDINHSLITIKK